MEKYSFEFKMKLIKEYLDGKGGFRKLSKQYGLPDASQLQRWVHNFKAFGEEGIKTRNKLRNYSVQFKIDAVELYLTTEISYRDLAVQLEMTNPGIISRWVTTFRAEGYAGLSRTKGQPPNMKNDKNKNKTHKQSPTKKGITDSERITELEEQVLSLQIQNAYLKELRSLQIKGNHNQASKSRESSTDSENNSN